MKQKQKSPTINFLYSRVYDYLLTKYEGKRFTKKQEEEIRKFIEELKNRWREIENPVMKSLVKILNVKVEYPYIQCYIVKYCKFSGISHPLTLKKQNDIERMMIDLIHELIHVFLPYEKWRKIYSKLAKEFPNEKPEIILHIYINNIQLQLLKKFFNPPTIEKFLKEAVKLKRTGKAWRIVLKKNNIK